VADGLLFKKMINSFLIISKAFSQQSVCVVWRCVALPPRVTRLAARPFHGEALRGAEIQRTL